MRYNQELFDELCNTWGEVIKIKNRYSVIVDSLLCELSKPIKDRNYDMIEWLRNESAIVSHKYEDRFAVYEAVEKRFYKDLKRRTGFIGRLKNAIGKLLNKEEK